MTVFTLLGVFFTTMGSGLNAEYLRSLAALLMIVAGIALLVPFLQTRLQISMEPLSLFANRKLASGKFQGLHGQFALGCLLGAVWSPCVGPALAAALGLASSSDTIVSAAVMMALYGLGASLPLMFIAYGSRRLFFPIEKICSPSEGLRSRYSGASWWPSVAQFSLV
ncbi:MAG: hypothetical protein HC902_11825 [Calothrix sp. SM1_5_4]|nr:hypothetical protein [Calothrix sp. SM1_5_4]